MRFTQACLALVALVGGCSAPEPVEPYEPREIAMEEQLEFNEKIEAIAKQVVDLTSADELFDSGDFIELYESPAGKAPLVAELYRDLTKPNLHKAIAGYSMQKLPTNELVWLIAQVVKLVQDEKLDPRLLDTLAFPALNWGARLQTEYERKDVRQCLEYLQGMKLMPPETRLYIRDEVLTGKAYKDVMQLRKAEQIP